MSFYSENRCAVNKFRATLQAGLIPQFESTVETRREADTQRDSKPTQPHYIFMLH